MMFHRLIVPVIVLASLVLGCSHQPRVAKNAAAAFNQPQVVDSNGYIGSFSSLEVISGRPCIAYTDNTNGNLMFVRSKDARGTGWHKPVVVDADGDTGQYSRLFVVRGKPAITYHQVDHQDLMYVRARDPGGNAWGDPVIVDGQGGHYGVENSPAVVEGHPAISYRDYLEGDLRYVRAEDPTGESWGQPQVLDSDGNTGLYTSLAAVNGYVAVAYISHSTYELKFITPSGSTSCG